MSDAGIAGEGASVQSKSAAARGGVRLRHRDRDFALRRALLLADWVGLLLALIVALIIAANQPDVIRESLWILPTLPFWAFLFRTYGLYQRPVRRVEPTHLDDMSSLLHALMIGTLALWLFYKFGPAKQLAFEEIVIFGLVSAPLIASLRVLVRTINLRIQGPERVFVVAPSEDVRLLQRKLQNHPEYEMELVGAARCDECPEPPELPLRLGLDEVDDLIGSGQIDHLVVELGSEHVSQERMVELMRACNRAKIRFGAFPREKSLLRPGVEINHVEGMGFLSYHPPVLSRSAQAMKRLLDVILSAVMLVLLAPLMASLALAVKLDSKGSIFYRQMRVGKEGRRFLLLKFRTMVPGADQMTAELMAQSNDPDWLILDRDPRVTRIGRVLRRSSLDELPQFWHVLKGEMSLVGPRPLSEVDDALVHGWGRNRLDLTPGITGYWQVLGRNNIPFREMVEIDYAYVANWSLAHDLKLLARTIPVVVRRRGAN
jgi:exopolysaccharide biosynthesis polyprenyl glycosylphosphotransferase